MPEATDISLPTANGNGKVDVSFQELVRAHLQWEKKQTSGDRAAAAEAERRFKHLLTEFEADAGQVIDAYWCHERPSAVALTRRVKPAGWGLGRPRVQYRLHRVSDWVSGENYEIGNLLHESDILGIKAAYSLDGVSRAVVMQWLLLVDSHLLGFLERYHDAPCEPHVTDVFADNVRGELRRIEDYYFRAGEKRARMRYVQGMLGFGVVLAVVSALAAAALFRVFGVFDLGALRIREFYLAEAAGATGAIISVLMRMSGRGSFAIDHELSRRDLTLVGALRPLIGAVSGVAVYFLFRTPVMPIDEATLTLSFFFVVAFLAGFSERWTRVLLSGAMRTISGDDGQTPSLPSPDAAAAAAEQKQKTASS
jgi:hypothetical protein